MSPTKKELADLLVPLQVPPQNYDQEQTKVTGGAVENQIEEPDGDNAESVEHRSSSVEVKLDSAAQALIGHQLRTLYGEIVREPVPSQLLKLLQDLERKEQE